MDYNNYDFINSTLNLSPGSSFGYAPSPCPEPLYNVRSGPNSLVNLPCCISAQGSSFCNLSPGRQTVDVTSSQSLRYHPYHSPLFHPYVGDVEFRRQATRNWFANDGCSEVYEKWLHPQLNYQRNINRHPTTGKEKYNEITNAKPNVRSKKDIKQSKTKNISKRNFPAQSVDSSLQTNYYDPNIVSNHVPTRVGSGNVPAQSIDYNPQRNYYSNAVRNNVPSEVMSKINFSAGSLSNNPRTNYNPNVVFQSASNTNMSQGNFSEQNISNNPPTNYYDPNILPNHKPNNVMPKTNSSAQSTDNNLQPNYNPNVVLQNAPKPNMSQGSFSEQSIDNNPSKNYYDDNIVPNHIPRKVMFKANSSAQSTDNKLQSNYNPNVVLNNVPSTGISMGNKGENRCSQQSSMANAENSAAGKYYSCVQVTEGNIDETKISAVNTTVTENTNFMTCGEKDFNTLPQGDLLQRLFASTVESGIVVSDVQQLNSLDLSNYQVSHATTPENSTFSVQDIRQEKLENIDLSSYSFDPIFEGKDENGEDMVVLLVNSNSILPSAQQADDGEDKTEAFADNQNSEIRNGQAVLNNISDYTEVGNKALLEPQVHEVNNEMGENILVSHINDYASEETVTTSKRKYVRTKKNNNKRGKNIDENVNQNSRENYTTSYATSQPSTSRETQNTATSTSHHTNTSYKRRKFGNLYFKHRMAPYWRRRQRIEPIRHIQRIFIKKFIRRVRIENEHVMVSEEFWNSYRLIVSQIGGSVMQTMYNILPALIRNSETPGQNINAAASKSTKNL